MTIQLHDYPLSANCYKVRLLLHLLDVEYETIPVDFYPGWEHKSATFRTVNPLGHIPVLQDADFVIRDAHAILVYLAAKYDASRAWYPTTDARALGQTAQWLLFAEGTTNTASAARLHVDLGYPFDLTEVQSGAHRLFRVLDEHLWFSEREHNGWVAGTTAPTIADLALFPDVALAGEGGVHLAEYPSLRRWTDRVRRLPGFVPMPGILPVD